MSKILSKTDSHQNRLKESLPKSVKWHPNQPSISAYLTNNITLIDEYEQIHKAIHTQAVQEAIRTQPHPCRGGVRIPLPYVLRIVRGEEKGSGV